VIDHREAKTRRDIEDYRASDSVRIYEDGRDGRRCGLRGEEVMSRRDWLG